MNRHTAYTKTNGRCHRRPTLADLPLVDLSGQGREGGIAERQVKPLDWLRIAERACDAAANIFAGMAAVTGVIAGVAVVAAVIQGDAEAYMVAAIWAFGYCGGSTGLSLLAGWAQRRLRRRLARRYRIK